MLVALVQNIVCEQITEALVLNVVVTDKKYSLLSLNHVV